MKSWQRLPLCLILAATAALAQTKPTPYRVLVLGAPFTGRAVTTTYTSVEGKPVEHANTELIARNADGWQWYRHNLQTTDPRTHKQHNDTWSFIWDPTKLTRTEWCDCKKTAYRKQFGPPATERPRPELLPGGMDLPSTNDRVKIHVDPLGTRVIQGEDTIGSLSTRTVKSTDGGKDLVSTYESWYCPRLHWILLSNTNDATRGKSKYEVLDLKPVPPDPTLLQLPAGYIVEAAKEAEQFE